MTSSLSIDMLLQKRKKKKKGKRIEVDPDVASSLFAKTRFPLARTSKNQGLYTCVIMENSFLRIPRPNRSRIPINLMEQSKRPRKRARRAQQPQQLNHRIGRLRHLDVQVVDHEFLIIARCRLTAPIPLTPTPGVRIYPRLLVSGGWPLQGIIFILVLVSPIAIIIQVNA